MQDPRPNPTFSAFPALPPPVRVPLTVCPEHACAYFPRRRARFRAFAASRFDPELYRRLMDANFRRSGEIFYQPVCRGCRACVQIRVPVDDFTPSKSQRRCLRRNADLKPSIAPPHPTAEKYELYRRYVHARHRQDENDRHAWETFLYQSPVQSLEVEYRDAAGRLAGVGICDVSPSSLSTVYFYFDPAQSARGLGTFSALLEIDLARRMQLPYYYLGYWIAGCQSMEYKRRFRPHELLGPDGIWRRADD